MTTVQLELPDTLAQSAQAAGLLTPQALEAMLREQLKSHADQALRTIWANEAPGESTPQLERLIDQRIHAVRARRCRQAVN